MHVPRKTKGRIKLMWLHRMDLVTYMHAVLCLTLGFTSTHKYSLASFEPMTPISRAVRSIISCSSALASIGSEWSIQSHNYIPIHLSILLGKTYSAPRG